MDSVNFREKTGLLLLGRKRHNVCNKNIIIQLIRPVIYSVHICLCLNETASQVCLKYEIKSCGHVITQTR